MISLTRLNGERIAINADLIERAEETPDTVLTLTNGTKYVVSESLEQLLEEMRCHRASVLATAARMAEDPEIVGTRLRLVTNEDGPHADKGAVDSSAAIDEVAANSRSSRLTPFQSESSGANRVTDVRQIDGFIAEADARGETGPGDGTHFFDGEPPTDINSLNATSDESAPLDSEPVVPGRGGKR